MIDIDLERSFDDPSEPSLPIAGRFTAIREYMNVLDEFIPLIQDQLAVRAKARIESEYRRRGELDVDDVESTTWVVRDLVPSSMYGALVLSISSALESSMLRILRYCERMDTSFRATRKPSSLGMLQHFMAEMERVLGTLVVERETTVAVEDLQLVRNVLAHTGGELQSVKGRRERLQELIGAGAGVRDVEGSIAVDRAFVQRRLDAAENLLNATLHQLFKRFPHAAAAP